EGPARRPAQELARVMLVAGEDVRRLAKEVGERPGLEALAQARPRLGHLAPGQRVATQRLAFLFLARLECAHREEAPLKLPVLRHCSPPWGLDSAGRCRRRAPWPRRCGPD